jgi:predicted RNase H-like nuclease (RuvC/YqgF family)
MTELTPAHFHVIDKNKAKSKEQDNLKKENKDLKDKLKQLEENIKQLEDPLNGFRKDGGL